MSVRWKLFASYIVVIAIGAVVLIVITLSVAPVTFTEHIGIMRGTMDQSMSGGMMADFETEVNDSFNSAISNALIIATLAATSAAAIVSAYVSYRITSPIQATVQASQRIASGHYDERLGVYSSDELGQLTQSFNRMAASLAETETTRQHLIADISHELKTPLTSIQGYMEGLQDGVIDPSQETFQQIHRETRRLQRLVHDLQELSRVEAGQMALQITTQELSGLLQSATEWIKPQFDDNQVTLSIHLPDAPINIQGDFDRIRQVILNLLGNALQYTPQGGTITIGCERTASDVIIHIRDTGIGLSKQDTERIFERFYRVDKSRSRLSGGSGIGLTIARHIVQAHGGDLWVESLGINRGSTFHIKLPYKTETL